MQESDQKQIKKSTIMEYLNKVQNSTERVIIAKTQIL